MITGASGISYALWHESMHESMHGSLLGLLEHHHLPGAAAGVPSLAADKVARVCPVDAECAIGSVGVSHAGMAIVPVRVVVAVVEACAGANCLTLLHVHHVHVFGGSGQDSGNSGKAGEERCEGDHDFDELLCLFVVD